MRVQAHGVLLFHAEDEVFRQSESSVIITTHNHANITDCGIWGLLYHHLLTDRAKFGKKSKLSLPSLSTTDPLYVRKPRMPSTCVYVTAYVSK